MMDLMEREEWIRAEHQLISEIEDHVTKRRLLLMKAAKEFGMEEVVMGCDKKREENNGN